MGKTVLVGAGALISTMLYATGAQAVTYWCPGGGITGHRAEYDGAIFAQKTESVAQADIQYLLAGSENVMVAYRGQTVKGVVLNRGPSYYTVAYVFGGVPYMDTLYLSAGVVYSTLHKDGNGGAGQAYPVATTWFIKGCQLGE
ncbi:hypothetical protein [Azospirillum sp.]|uniref:hypothetical protein n=1 Tax=Azospirillum sp. TaxID=34012 RepID=UPI002D40F01D|nr:hypothetical protein [Azospirillum sp.]HYD69287.1 hypothetical protein [Azospirillum sp.]